MPVRSLSSPVLRWPDARAVTDAARRWAARAARARLDVARIGCFGSYVRGDWGVGSDLDIVVVLDHSLIPFERRAAEWDTTSLPVPVDVLVYTSAEWRALCRGPNEPPSFAPDVEWAYKRDG